MANVSIKRHSGWPVRFRHASCACGYMRPNSRLVTASRSDWPRLSRCATSTGAADISIAPRLCLSSATVTPTKPLVGAHVEPKRPLETAAALGADCVQIFLSDPQGWEKPSPRPDADELRDSDVPVYVHAPYLINVCSPKSNVRYGSRKILQQTCDAAADVGAVAVIVHPGHAEDGIEPGVGRWTRTLEMLHSDVPVYLENTAGGDNAVARRVDAPGLLRDAGAAADPEGPIR